MELACSVRKRHSSYSQRARSTPGGGSASFMAAVRSSGLDVPESEGCVAA